MPGDHPLTVCEKVPEWVHDVMIDMDYHLMPCSWANALYEWYDHSADTPDHHVEMFFFKDGEQVRLLITQAGDTYLNGFCKKQDTDLLEAKIATLRQRLRSRHA